MIDMTQCLIVDSSPCARRKLECLLSPYGFDLAAMTDMDDALDYCRREAPDVVLLADRPGGPDAVGFIRRLRTLHRGRQPIVLVCADEADAENIGRAIWAGAADCLVRPFDAEVLDAKLRMSGLV
jgi:two-component system chemotaxis response regulator CheY